MLKIFVFVLVLGFSWARHFNNPVVDKDDTPDPAVTKYNGRYYAVTTSNNDSPNKFPIRTSNDLQNWEIESYVLTENSRPVWSTDVEYWAPEIHILGEGQFRVYFTTREIKSGRLCIGAAFATNILGPYYSLDRPLVLDLSQDILDATLVNDNGRLYLIWKGSEWMYARELRSDGLSFLNDDTSLLLRNDLEWESYIIEAPFVVQRNGSFYLFYSGNEYCGTKYSVGVARSSNILGPYEKRGDPILVTDEELAGPGHCSVAKDVNDIDYVMAFHAYKANQVCNPYPRLMSIRSMSWGDDGWPFMTD